MQSDVLESKDNLDKGMSDSSLNGVSVNDACSFSPEPEMLEVVPDLSVFSDFNSEASCSSNSDLLSHRCDYFDLGSDGVGDTDSKTAVSRSDCVSSSNSMAKKFECGLCNKTFLQGWNLERHKKLIHQKVKSFECMFCSKMFKLKSVLIQHQSIDTDEKFACDVCSKVYKNLPNLRRHKLVHASKSFNCEVCGSSFSRNDNLSRHKKLHEK